MRIAGVRSVVNCIPPHAECHMRRPSSRSVMTVTPGVVRRIFPAWLAYFKPGFHPWDHDDRALIRKHEGDFADALMPAE